MKAKIECVGIHSLFFEAHRAGTDLERHVLLVDLDEKTALTDPRAFRVELRRAMRAHGIPDVWILETRKGVHVFSPWLQSRRHTERFEEALEAFGSDGFHRWMGYKNGGTVLRITPKPGEGEPCGRTDLEVRDGLARAPLDCPTCFGVGWTGPRFVTHVSEPGALAAWSYWCWPHWDLMRQRYNLPESPYLLPERRLDGAPVRVEHYETPAPKVLNG